MTLNHSGRHRERASKDDESRGNKPGTFDLLGFTYYWDKTRKGGWAVKRKTMKSRLARSIQRIDQWCRKNMHKPVREQWEKLKAKVKGHYAYFGIRKLPFHLRAPLLGRTAAERAAQSPKPREQHDLKGVQPSSETLPLASSQDCPQHLQAEDVRMKWRSKETSMF
ncbi:MAG: hypothetical protein FWH27_02405 [Planctomycetaceae bacterium]|nr:hypothetical protein [Planctomycetaceae bacterium]